MNSNLIKVGQEYYNSEGFTSENVLTSAGLLEPDELTQAMTYLNTFIKDYSPFMWLNAGQGGFNKAGSVELEGDGQYYWNVMGELKEHDTIIGSPYTGSDKPGINLEPFSLHLSSSWIKEGWLIRFRDGYIGRIDDQPIDKGTYWLYKVRPYTVDKGEYCSLDNLRPGNLVRESVYLVPGRFDVGTESNSQTPYKRTNQISKIRWTHRITGNIANKKVATFNLPTGDGGAETKYWIDFDYWFAMHLNEMKTERFLFEESIYNRDANGRISLTDRRSGGEPIMTGASVKQMIEAEGNFSGYGINFTLDYWERTVGDITYGTNKNIDLIGYCGEMYMDDFSRAIERESSNRGYHETEGDLRVTRTSSGLSFDSTRFVQYKTRRGDLVTLIHLPFLDNAGTSEQIRHPRTGKPLSSHSCYYIAQGLDDDGTPNVQMISEKGESKVVGIYRGMTNIPNAWGASNSGNMSMIDLATERNEASIHERRSIGVNIRNTKYTFYHFADADEF